MIACINKKIKSNVCGNCIVISGKYTLIISANPNPLNFLKYVETGMAYSRRVANKTWKLSNCFFASNYSKKSFVLAIDNHFNARTSFPLASNRVNAFLVHLIVFVDSWRSSSNADCNLP